MSLGLGIIALPMCWFHSSEPATCASLNARYPGVYVCQRSHDGNKTDATMIHLWINTHAGREWLYHLVGARRSREEKFSETPKLRVFFLFWGSGAHMPTSERGQLGGS